MGVAREQLGSSLEVAQESIESTSVVARGALGLESISSIVRFRPRRRAIFLLYTKVICKLHTVVFQRKIRDPC